MLNPMSAFIGPLADARMPYVRACSPGRPTPSPCGASASAAVGDKGDHSRANRATARARGICPVIPVKRTAKVKPALFFTAIDKGRARIEQTVGKLN